MTFESDESTARVSPRQLETFATAVLKRAGVTDPHAAIVSDALVRADLRGVDSHGVARLNTYARKFETGGFDTDPDISVNSLSGGLVLVDADDGPGQSAGVRAIDEAMKLSRTHGIGLAAVTNSNHFGTAAFYTEQASSADLIGISMTNVVSDVAPFGGIKPFLGTNPISFSIPTDLPFPITLDMATSVAAKGKIDHASDEQDRIPETWAFDADGEPTTDPSDVAALRPLGGPKGYGLGIVVDILCGLLTGVGTSPTVGPLYDDYDEPMRLGHVFAAIDPSAFRNIEEFKADVGAYVEAIKEQPRRDDVDEIRVPGELEWFRKRDNEQDGIQLNDDARTGLETLSERYDIPLPDSLN